MERTKTRLVSRNYKIEDDKTIKYFDSAKVYLCITKKDSMKKFRIENVTPYQQSINCILAGVKPFRTITK